MSDTQQNIEQYLSKMGLNLTVPWESAVNPQGTTMISSQVTYMGLIVWLHLSVAANTHLALTVPMGYVPRTNVAPLYRALLVQSTSMAGAYFCIFEPNVLAYRTARDVSGMDADEFRKILDNMVQVWMNVATPIIHQFQVPAQPQ